VTCSFPTAWTNTTTFNDVDVDKKLESSNITCEDEWKKLDTLPTYTCQKDGKFDNEATQPCLNPNDGSGGNVAGFQNYDGFQNYEGYENYIKEVFDWIAGRPDMNEKSNLSLLPGFEF